ncbi:MAG: integration host factor subunit beta [Bacteroidales bacterium]|nr:integration host factor subunit beta [Bacteroidales bacterium]
MTKAELVAEVAKKTGIERVAVQATIEEMMSAIKEAMAEGENVYFRGFGTFEIVRRAAKIGRNITKNTSVEIPEHNVPKFKPCKEFMDMVK